MHRLATGFAAAIVCLSCQAPVAANSPAAASTARQPETKKTVEKTKLELFGERRGAVLITGMNELGKIDGQYGGEVAVTALEVSDTTSHDAERGLTIRMAQTGPPAREKACYVDEAEIPAFLSAIDSLAKTDTSVTRLKNFEAEYVTADGLRVATFNTPKEILASLKIGEDPEEVRVFLSLDKLAHFRALVANAKTMLDVAGDPARAK